MVTLLNSTVAGLVSRFGATTASSDVKPSLLLVSALANADSDGAAARTDDQVDVGNFVAVSDERFADHHAIDLCHGVWVSLGCVLRMGDTLGRRPARRLVALTFRAKPARLAGGQHQRRPAATTADGQVGAGPGLMPLGFQRFVPGRELRGRCLGPHACQMPAPYAHDMLCHGFAVFANNV